MIERPKTVDFSGAQVGDKVTCLLEGSGTIRNVEIYGGYPILVDFVSDSERYSESGLVNECCSHPSLFYGHFDGWPTEENLVRPIDPVTFEKDEKVMASDDNIKWYSSHYARFEHGKHNVFINGTNSWTCKTFQQWNYCREPTAEELKS